MGSFQIRKIQKNGELTLQREGSEGELDESTIEQLYLPVKKYFVKKYQAPIVLNVHITRNGTPCLDFIGDARIPSDFDFDHLIDTYRKVVHVFTQSNYDATSLRDFKTNISPCIPYLSGDSRKIITHSDKYDYAVFRLVRELYPQ